MLSLLNNFRKIRKDIDNSRNEFKSTNELTSINQIDNEEIRRVLLLLSDSHRTELKHNNNNIYKILTEIVITNNEMVMEYVRQIEKINAFEKKIKWIIPGVIVVFLFIIAFSLYKIDPIAFKEVTNTFISIFKIFNSNPTGGV